MQFLTWNFPILQHVSRGMLQLVTPKCFLVALPRLTQLPQTQKVQGHEILLPNTLSILNQWAHFIQFPKSELCDLTTAKSCHFYILIFNLPCVRLSFFLPLNMPFSLMSRYFGLTLSNLFSIRMPI